MAQDFDDVRVVFESTYPPQRRSRQGGNEIIEKQHTIISKTTYSSRIFLSKISFLVQVQKMSLQNTLPRKSCAIPEALQIDLKGAL